MSVMSLLKDRLALTGALYVAGCCIGAGMIGLPVISAAAGFIPAGIVMMLCCVFTTLTGLLILEATLWFDQKVNLPSIVEMTLGKFGKVLTLGLFMSLFYCIFVAYIDGGGALFQESLSAILHTEISRTTGMLSCVGLVALLTYAGTKIVVDINRALLVGLFGTYVILVAIGLPNISVENLQHIELKASFATIPIILICFGYQNLVPGLTHYLDKDVARIRFAIILGNIIPLVFYLIWNLVILGLIPNDQASHLQGRDMVTDLLQGSVQSFSIIFFVKAFSLFAMLTSFIPNAISMVDFLEDGCKKLLHRRPNNRLLFLNLVLIPPFLFCFTKPDLFLQALSWAGGFIDILLFGVLPSLVILVGRKMRTTPAVYQVKGGKAIPILILCISVLVLIMKVS